MAVSDEEFAQVKAELVRLAEAVEDGFEALDAVLAPNDRIAISTARTKLHSAKNRAQQAKSLLHRHPMSIHGIAPGDDLPSNEPYPD